MAVTPGVRSSQGDRLPKRLRHRRMEPERTPPPPPWPRAPSRRNVNRRCHDTSISLGEQQVSVIKRQVLVITRRQTQPMSSVCGRAPYWQEMHEVSPNEINRTHRLHTHTLFYKHQLSDSGQSRMRRVPLPASFRINHRFSIPNFNFGLQSRLIYRPAG